MIIDLQRFITEERPCWDELDAILSRLGKDPAARLSLEQVERLHYLYQRVSAGLAKLTTFASEPELRRYLESLVARAYGEIHETRRRARRFALHRWFLADLPQSFRRHLRAFLLAVAVTFGGALFGGGAVAWDPGAKAVLLPFSHLQGDPAERVQQEEEEGAARHLDGRKASFASYLMTHNTRVSFFSLALGMSWGVGTLVLLFYNGVILGAVGVDYLAAGQARFLFGWLLPHGAVEIPAFLIAGQAGLVLAGALVGWGRRFTLRQRLRAVAGDVVNLAAGAALLLVWAGFVESFLSQYHEPVVPYAAKIGVGVVELFLLAAFLWKSGAGATPAVAQGKEDRP